MSFFIFTVLWTRLSVSVCSISLFRPGTHCCPAKNHYKTITDFFCSRLSSFGFDWLDKTRPSTCNIRQYRRPCRRCIGGIWEPGLNPKLPLARERYFSCPNSGSRAESQLVPVLLRITAEPESAYERFNALTSYALHLTVTKRAKTSRERPAVYTQPSHHEVSFAFFLVFAAF